MIDMNLKANIRAKDMRITPANLLKALHEINAVYCPEPVWLKLEEALAAHRIPSTTDSEFRLVNWTGPIEQAPDQFEIEDILKILAPYFEPGGEFEFSAEDFSDEGEVLEFNRGFYRFRDGKMYSVVNNGLRISQEDKDYLADLADRIYKCHQIQSTIHATTFYDSTRLKEIVANCGQVETEVG